MQANKPSYVLLVTHSTNNKILLKLTHTSCFMWEAEAYLGGLMPDPSSLWVWKNCTNILCEKNYPNIWTFENIHLKCTAGSPFRFLNTPGPLVRNLNKINTVYPKRSSKLSWSESRGVYTVTPPSPKLVCNPRSKLHFRRKLWPNGTRYKGGLYWQPVTAVGPVSP